MSAPRKLRAVSLRAEDFLGAEDVEIRPGRITVLSGPNGSGKSTALAAFAAVLGRGSIQQLARIDPQGKPTEPRLVLVLEDGAGRQLVAERTGTRPRLRERDAAGALRDVAQPQRAIAALWDSAAANPVAFLGAAPDERIKLLYEALPLELDRERVDAILRGLDVARPPEGLHALTVLSYLRDQVYAARTAVNRDAKSKAEAADQIRRSAPAAPALEPADLDRIQAAAQELALEVDRRDRESAQLEQAARDGAARELAAARGKAEEEFSRASEAISAQLQAQVSEWRLELERRIAEAREVAGAKIDHCRANRDAILTEAEQRMVAVDAEAAAARRERDEQLADLRAELAHAQEAATIAGETAKVAASAAALAAQAESFEADARSLRAAADRHSEALKALDEYTRGLAAELPAGLEVRGRELYLDGINFDSQNTARRIEAAVAVSCLRARAAELPLVLVDGAEALDPAHFNALLDALEAAGVQALVTAVSPNPDARGLHVEAVA